MAEAQSFMEWRGRNLIDRDGDKIGKLEDVYVDTETDEQLFGTVKEGLVSRHLTFVPLRGATADPDGLHVRVSKQEVKGAPNIDTDGELSREGESALFAHYGLDYRAPPTQSGRRLGRR
ncbi:MAG TPA: PRC-barrel domain-containing protein [Thermoleophilaceae bacterium]|nr:PRC-barrel domain-containing protein [Thermoleophilaceae bacterium]